MVVKGLRGGKEVAVAKMSSRKDPCDETVLYIDYWSQ